MAEKTCFIIMPITTPEAVQGKYRDGADHFRHVLDCLLTVSVEKAGFKALPPVAEGADLIHAEIIKQLEAADLVLCDMSALNPNVFFEFGIRCALNKPVCIIKDDVTDKVPFDTSVLNHHKYKNTLEAWELPSEIESLVNHIEASVKRCKDSNPLWKYFGVRADAAPAKGGEGSEETVGLLFMQMDAVQRQLGELAGRIGYNSVKQNVPVGREEFIIEWLGSNFPKLDISQIFFTDNYSRATVYCSNFDRDFIALVHERAIRDIGVWLTFIIKAGPKKPPIVLFEKLAPDIR